MTETLVMTGAAEGIDAEEVITTGATANRGEEEGTPVHPVITETETTGTPSLASATTDSNHNNKKKTSLSIIIMSSATIKTTGVTVVVAVVGTTILSRTSSAPG